VGAVACSLFTGKICKDGSCNGPAACQYAKIPLVANSCKDANGPPCYFAGSGGGTLVVGMKNSCNGERACQYLGQGRATGGGKVEYLLDSCNGYYGCANAGYQGTIGFIKSSCNGSRACNDLARDGGKSGNVQDSCNAAYSCDSAAKGTSKFIGEISMSCNGANACQYLTGINSTNLNNCCNSDNECTSKNELSLPAQCSVRGVTCIFFLFDVGVLLLLLCMFFTAPPKSFRLHFILVLMPLPT